MSSQEEDSSAIPQEVQQLVDQIRNHCSKIPVAKEGSLQLTDLCNELIEVLRAHPLIRRRNYHGIVSNLVHIEEQLVGWSKYNLPKGLVKRSQIELDIAGCVGTLGSVLRFIRPVPPGQAEYNEPLPIKRLDGEVTREGETAFAGGLCFEVWVGRWRKSGREEDGGEKVALKTLRTQKAIEKARERLERELPRWAGLHNQNVQPFYGIVTDIESRLHTVSPWQENGNLLAYVRNNPGSDKNYLLRASAAGLNYLHSQGVVHGSVKCKNVLISREGEPQICDFGMAQIGEEAAQRRMSTSGSSGDAVRYSAPECILNNNFSATTESDTYSFAMLILECITEEVPFPTLSRGAVIIHARITKRLLPPRPDGQDPKNRVSDGLWDLMMRCWSEKPGDRPTIEQVRNFFLHQV